MSSGPVVVMVLEGNDAVAKNRKIMGATNPKDATKNVAENEVDDSILWMYYDRRQDKQ